MSKNGHFFNQKNVKCCELVYNLHNFSPLNFLQGKWKKWGCGDRFRPKNFMKMEERMKKEWRKNGKKEKMTFFDNFKNNIFSFGNEHVLLPGQIFIYRFHYLNDLIKNISLWFDRGRNTCFKSGSILFA